MARTDAIIPQEVGPLDDTTAVWAGVVRSNGILGYKRSVLVSFPLLVFASPERETSSRYCTLVGPFFIVSICYTATKGQHTIVAMSRPPTTSHRWRCKSSVHQRMNTVEIRTSSSSRSQCCIITCDGTFASTPVGLMLPPC